MTTSADMDQRDPLKRQVQKGALWAFFETFVQRGVAFVITMVLTRLLTPDDYGILALLTIFTSVAYSVASSGLGQSLVQKKDATETDFNSVFYASLVLAAGVYLLLFAAAPFIALYFETPEIKWLLRVLSLSIVFSSINSVQNAELNRKMLFHLSFRISLISSTFSAITGITTAFCHFGPWALVCSILASDISGVIARWFIIAWRPRLLFSWKSFHRLWSFGWKLSASYILDSLYKDLYGVFIGKMYTKADLAIVNRGRQVAALPMDSINGTLVRVIFPAFSKLQDDPVRLRNAMRRMIQSITFLLTPVMVGIAICAETIVPLLFGKQWSPCIPYVRMACFSYMIWPISSMNIEAMNAMGRSNVFFKLEIAKKIFAVVFVLIFVRHGVFPLMFSLMIGFETISLLINIFPNRKYLGYTLVMSVQDLIPSLLLSILMALAILPFSFISHGTIRAAIICLIVQVLLGGIVYVTMARLFKVMALKDVLNSIQHIFGKIPFNIFRILFWN